MMYFGYTAATANNDNDDNDGGDDDAQIWRTRGNYLSLLVVPSACLVETCGQGASVCCLCACMWR